MLPKDLKGRPAIVVWDDAHMDLESYDKGDSKILEYQHALTYSIGIITKVTKHGIIMFYDYIPGDKTYRGRGCIPKGMVREIIYLDSV